MTARELENARDVNTYREYLGIFPYEFDPRLVKAARGHSKEMVDLKYFDHDSPAPPTRRPGTASEKPAIKAGRAKISRWASQRRSRLSGCGSTAPATTRIWLHGNTALGVGNVGIHWTQNMGSANG